MELPIEIYVVIYGIANDLKITKSLRLVSKSALNASHIYHKILIKTSVLIGSTSRGWFLSSIEENTDKNLKKKLAKHHREDSDIGILWLGDDHWNEYTGFKMSVKDLLSISH